MNILLIGIALAGVALVVVWLLIPKSPAARPAPARGRPAQAQHRPGAGNVAPASSGAKAAPMVAAVREIPPELAAFQMALEQELPAEKRAAYRAVFKDVPRPPRLLQHLMSPDFVNAASSAQLVDLIAAEPLIAGKVLAAVNSPLYGLRSPVVSIGQAVTYLGLNAVRSLCLQYILISAFRADSSERKQALETTWRASAIASELVQQLSYRLNLADPGTLVSAVVLSFLGRLATAATMPRPILASIPARDLLQRASAEQARLGLCASQIGRLLMAEWGLPAQIIDDASDVDRVLVAPDTAFDRQRGFRLALCYLCARLGERLAAGEMHDLLAFDLPQQQDAELHHFRGHLADPRLARLADLVQSPDLSTVVERLLASFQRTPARVADEVA